MKYRTFHINVFRLLIIVLIFNSCPGVFAANTQDELIDARIKGVAQFLLDRAQDNFLYILGQNITKNEIFKLYFPNTHYFISSGDLRLLLKSNSKIWSEIVERDVRQIIERFIIVRVGGRRTVRVLSEISFDKELNREIGEKLEKYIVDLKDNSALDAEIKHEVLRKLGDYKFLLGELIKAFKQLQAVDFNECEYNRIEDMASVKCNDSWQMFNLSSWKKYTDILDEIGETGKQLFDGIYKDIQDASFSRADLSYDRQLWDYVRKKITSSWWIFYLAKEKIPCIPRADIETSSFSRKNNLITIASSDQPLNLIFLEFERYVMECVSPIRKTETEQNILFGVDIYSREYKRFRKYALFFTQLSTADSPDQVEALLVEMTLPAASFAIKREVGEQHLMFSAYLGFIGGVTFSTAGDENFKNQGGYAGITAPMGIEWSYGCKSSGDGFSLCPRNSSFNILIAPVDFMHPINVIVTDNDDQVALDDIIAPGIFFSYGWDGYPVNCGFGVQQGKAIRADSELENRYFVFISFEIPMFVLH